MIKRVKTKIRKETLTVHGPKAKGPSLRKRNVSDELVARETPVWMRD